MSNTHTSSTLRYRNFACVVYPDSAPHDWQRIISELCIPCFISPLHDKDTNPTGEPKKAHWHVLFAFDGKKSVEQVNTLFAAFGGVGCDVVQSLRGYARYLCHLDNPEKAQYAVDDVATYGGACYSDVIGLPCDKYKAIGEMVDFCNFNHIRSFSELVDYARMCRADWFHVLADSSTLFMKEYLKSAAWTDSLCGRVDGSTGELL